MNVLYGDRPINTQGNVGYIPYQSIIAYMQWNAIENSEFLELLQDVDRAFINKRHELAMKKQQPVKIRG